MTTDRECAVCKRAMRHDVAAVCAHCGNELRGRLARTAKLVDEIETTVARLDRITRTGGGKREAIDWYRGGNALESWPLPFNVDASIAYAAAYGELASWAWSGHGALDTVCTALADQVDSLRRVDAEHARAAFVAIEAACRTIERVIDRGPERIVVGRCPCGTWLYALAGAKTVQCEGCGIAYDVESSRQALRDALVDRLMTGAQIATMAVHLGIVDRRDKARNAVKTWAARGRLAQHGLLDGDPSYRFGDALVLLINAYAR